MEIRMKNRKIDIAPNGLVQVSNVNGTGEKYKFNRFRA